MEEEIHTHHKEMYFFKWEVIEEHISIHRTQMHRQLQSQIHPDMGNYMEL